MSAVAELAQALDAARRALESGSLPDLEPLAHRLATLLASAGRDDRRRELAPLIGLLDEATRLGEALAQKCRACSAELARGEANARAAAAYRNRARS